MSSETKKDACDYLFLSQGNTAEIYQYGEHKILKLFRKAMPFVAISHEYEMTRQLQEKLDFIPKAYELLEYRERHGIVYEQIVGTDMIQLILKHILRTNDYCRQMASIHVRIHQKSADLHYSVKEKLRRDIEAASDLTLQEKEKVKKYLASLPDGDKICHFDFHPGNIMIQEGKPVVIDWMTACTGTPAADVARTSLLMQMGEMVHISPLIRLLLKLFMKIMGGTYQKEYRRLTSISQTEIHSWMLPIAAARLSEWLTEHERKKLVLLVRKELKKYEEGEK